MNDDRLPIEEKLKKTVDEYADDTKIKLGNSHAGGDFDLNGIHKVTGTKYDWDGYDRYGIHTNIHYVNAMNKEFGDRGFNKDGIHIGTDTLFNLDGFDKNGYDKNGYDKNGFNVNGYDKDGYDSDGTHILNKKK